MPKYQYRLEAVSTHSWGALYRTEAIHIVSKCSLQSKSYSFQVMDQLLPYRRELESIVTYPCDKRADYK